MNYYKPLLTTINPLLTTINPLKPCSPQRCPPRIARPVIQVVPLETATAHGAQAQMNCNSAVVKWGVSWVIGVPAQSSSSYRTMGFSLIFLPSSELGVPPFMDTPNICFDVRLGNWKVSLKKTIGCILAAYIYERWLLFAYMESSIRAYPCLSKTSYLACKTR